MLSPVSATLNRFPPISFPYVMFLGGSALTLMTAALKKKIPQVEHHRSQPIPALQHLTQVRERDYGTTRLTFLRYA